VLLELYEINGKYEEIIKLGIEERETLRLALDDDPSPTSSPSASPIESSTSRVFYLISHQKLFESVTNDLLALFELDQEETLSLLCENMDDPSFHPEHVASVLRVKPQLLLLYLDALLHRCTGSYNTAEYEAFHALQMQLYERFDRPNLLGFLKLSNHYDLEAAYQMCLQADPSKSLTKELVHVLTRMNRVREALIVLMEEAKDVEQAVNLISHYDDEELWGELVARVIKSRSGDQIGQLLSCIPATPLNPLKIIMNTPNTIDIPNLSTKLLDIIRVRWTFFNMIAGSDELIKRDFMTLISRLTQGYQSGVHMDGGLVCSICMDPIIDSKKPKVKAQETEGEAEEDGAAPGGNKAGENDVDASEGIDASDENVLCRIFYCNHTFHPDCLARYEVGAVDTDKTKKKELLLGERDDVNEDVIDDEGLETDENDIEDAEVDEEEDEEHSEFGSSTVEKKKPRQLMCPLCTSAKTERVKRK
jgi:hypothetical protein